MPSKGIFITFEGPEGCGKSTHIKLVEKYLKMKGIPIVVTCEPGGTKLGKEIRKILLNTSANLTNEAEIFLFAADRSQHIQEVVMPALSQGKVVLSDRYIDSTIAYQIGGRNLPEDLVRYVIGVSSKGLVPDLTILLDVHPSIGIARAMTKSAASDRFESLPLQFHEKIRQQYLEIAKQNPDRITVINSEQSLEKVAELIKEQINSAVK